MPTPVDRRHTASRLIKASPAAVFSAFVAPEALASWLPPEGAKGDIEVFEPREGGRFRIRLTFKSAPGKTSADTDIVEGRFVELSPGERIVQTVQFVSDDPDFAGTMTMTWTLAPAPDGALVTICADNAPRGISRADHELGMASSLANLARFLE